MDEERHALICRPTEGYAPSVPGSTREYCEVCGTEVWASPASVVAAGGNPMFLCIDCAPGVMRAERDPILLPTTAAQWHELRQLRRERNG